MSEVHVQAVFEQFPWLNDHFSKCSYSHATVKRMDVDFLEHFNWALGSDCLKYRVYLFDKDGKQLTGIPGFFKRWLFERPKKIGTIIEDLGLEMSCEYGVVLDGSASITIYRTPRERSISDLFQDMREQPIQELEKARSEIRNS